jgi:hypothetical protein
MVERVGESHGAAERQEMGQGKAGRIVAEKLRRRGWRETDLEQRRKRDAQKVQIAAHLRQESIMTLKWLEHRLHLGKLDACRKDLKCQR